MARAVGRAPGPRGGRFWGAANSEREGQIATVCIAGSNRFDPGWWPAVSTIREIAKQAGVSVSTASLALNGDRRVRPETRERVLKVARELNYHPMRAARSLSSGRTWTLYLLNPLVGTDLSAGFFTRFSTGVHHWAAERGYSVGLSLVSDQRELDQAARRIVHERWADGLIVVNPTTDAALFRWLAEIKFPHVVLGWHEECVFSVDSDNAAAAKEAAAYLLEKAGGPVLFLGGPVQQTFAHERAAGYRQALEAAGIPFDDRYVIFSSGGSAEAGLRAVRQALQDGLPFRSVLAVSDALAVGAMRAVREAGLRVPGDVAVMGMNNDDITEYTDPPLTSVDLRAEELGREAAAMLLDVIGGSLTGPARRLVPHALVARESA